MAPLLALLAWQAVAGTGLMAAQDMTLPSASLTDGRFILVAGREHFTEASSLLLWISVPADQTTVDVSLFDGDLGGAWDNHDSIIDVTTEFRLYADPLKSGALSGLTQVATASSAGMADKAWSTIYSGAVHPAARAPSGNYFYLLHVSWSDPSRSFREVNAFKLRTSGIPSIAPSRWAFVGAPINFAVDPAFGTAANTYNGQWDWYAWVPGGAQTLRFRECDADARLNPTAPGSPPDDLVAVPTPTVILRIPPDIRYAVLRPNGQILIDVPIPSGNLSCSTQQAAVQTGGSYRWNWIGVDAHNLVFIDVDYELFSAALTPLPVRLTPTATATAVASATRTGIPTSPPTQAPRSPTPGRPSDSSAPAPQPSATATPPTPTATATLMPTGTVTAVATPTRSALTPTGAKPATTPKQLPKSGGAPLAGAAVVIASLGALAGRRLLRTHRR